MHRQQRPSCLVWGVQSQGLMLHVEKKTGTTLLYSQLKVYLKWKTGICETEKKMGNRDVPKI